MLLPALSQYSCTVSVSYWTKN